MTHNTRENSIGRRGFLGATACGTALVGLGGIAVVTPTSSTAATADDPLGLATADIDITALPRVKLALVPPPMVPAHDQIATSGPKIVEVTMTIIE